MTKPLEVGGQKLGDSIRKHVRIRVMLHAVFKVDGDESGTMFRAETKNISHGGACLQIDENKKRLKKLIDDGSSLLKVSLTLRDPDSPLETYIKTTWIESHLCWLVTPSDEGDSLTAGVSFDNVEEANAAKIEEFTKDLLLRQRETIYRDRIKTVLKNKHP